MYVYEYCLLTCYRYTVSNKILVYNYFHCSVNKVKVLIMSKEEAFQILYVSKDQAKYKVACSRIANAKWPWQNKHGVNLKITEWCLEITHQLPSWRL